MLVVTRLIPALALAAALAAAVPAHAGGNACAPGAAVLRWPGGSARFAVEIADDAEERARGLMFRPALPASAGMLFVYDRPHPAAFWMKNTLIPLDIIFFDAAGRAVTVHENAMPGDETPIPGGDAVQYVLEIQGGLARKLGLKPGAELRSPYLAPGQAAWPCE